jgi:hypothetical protein
MKVVGIVGVVAVGVRLGVTVVREVARSRAGTRGIPVMRKDVRVWVVRAGGAVAFVVGRKGAVAIVAVVLVVAVRTVKGRSLARETGERATQNGSWLTVIAATAKGVRIMGGGGRGGRAA